MAHRGRPRHDDRPYVEAMLWIARTGSPWRDLPERFPKWQSVYTRWRRWVQRQVWAKLLAWLADEHDPEHYAVDATYVRVHAHGTRARGGYQAQAVGRSRGGLTSKVHLLVDALGYPVRFVVTGGERNDVTQAPALLPPGRGAQVICDRGYDAD
jgi:transposase